MNEKEMRRELRALKRELSQRQFDMERLEHTARTEELTELDELRERIEDTRQALGESWTPTLKEQKMQEFQERLSKLTWVNFSMRQFSGGW